jgi:TolB protein
MEPATVAQIEISLVHHWPTIMAGAGPSSTSFRSEMYCGPKPESEEAKQMTRRQRIVRAALLFSIALLVEVGPGAAEAAGPPTGRIVFSSFDNASTSDIYSINPDGSGLKNLTSTPNDYEQMSSVSRDGTKIVFRRGFDPVSAMELYTMNADGSGVTRVTNNAFAEDFDSWTPDGRQIIFSGNQNNADTNCLYPPCNWDLFIVRADGTHLRELTFGPDQELDPKVSPDGRKVLFTRISGLTDSALYTMNLDGSHIMPVNTPPELLAGAGDWSPDGTRIVFSSNSCVGRCGAGDIWTANPDGSALLRVTNDNFNDVFAAWSPDGQWIVYTRRAFGANPDIVRVRPDGTDSVVLTQQVHGGGFEPSWGPG